MGLQIVGTGKALPKNKVTNNDLCNIVDTSDEWITTRTGIKSRYKCEDENALSLAIEAAKKAIENASINKADIGLLLVATTSSDELFPSVACMVQAGLNLTEDVMAFDISAACTGFIYGLGVAETTLNTWKKQNREKYGLVIGTEKLSSILDYSDRTTCILFGDGAGAAVVKATDNLFYQRSWSRGNREALNCKRLGIEGNSPYLAMRGNDVFKFAVTALEQAIRDVLKDTGFSMADVDEVICHQANERIINHVAKRFQEDQHKFHMNISEYGNTSAASVALLLDELNDKGIVTKGKRFIFVGFGAGLTWSAIIFEQ